MIKIGPIRSFADLGRAYIASDVNIDGEIKRLWFSVTEKEGNFLTKEKADPFFMALLPTAMRGTHIIESSDPVSARLGWQTETLLAPALAAAGGMYKIPEVRCSRLTSPYPSLGETGTGFSGGVDSLYTILTHPDSSLYPVTRLAVFNSGVFEGRDSRRQFEKACRAAEEFARENGLNTVFLDSNLAEVLPERFLDVYSFRNLACALALQGLFGTYLLSSGREMAGFEFDLHNSASYDALTVQCASTESLRFHLSGSEVKRTEKLEALSEWRPSHKWLHPCIYGTAGEMNCGRCQKCARDQTTLCALGKLESFYSVFDTDDYKRHQDARVGFVLALKENRLYSDCLELMEKKGVRINPQAFVFEKMFRKAMKREK